jgi:signal transduction histidine kinase
MTTIDRTLTAPQQSLLRFVARRCSAAVWALAGHGAGGTSPGDATLLTLEGPAGPGLQRDHATATAAGPPADPRLPTPLAGDDGPPSGPAADRPSRDMFQVVEDERMRIARELHDGPAQLMANLVLKAEIVERLFSRDAAQALVELAEFRTTARLALDETRQLIFDLRPMALDDLGLAPALSRLLTDLGERHATRIGFRLVGAERRLPHDVEASLFRIVQEATNNALRHAHATSIDVTLTMRPGDVRASIRDDGSGFDVAEARARSLRTRRLGLASMRERAALHGGALDVVSAPGRGTHVRVSVRC